MNINIYYCDKCKREIQDPKYVVEVSEIYPDSPYCQERYDLCSACFSELKLPKSEKKREVFSEQLIDI